MHISVVCLGTVCKTKTCQSSHHCSVQVLVFRLHLMLIYLLHLLNLEDDDELVIFLNNYFLCVWIFYVAINAPFELPCNHIGHRET